MDGPATWRESSLWESLSNNEPDPLAIDEPISKHDLQDQDNS